MCRAKSQLASFAGRGHGWRCERLRRNKSYHIYDGNGALSRPLLYASGRRLTWMQLHAAITEQASIPYSLEDLATDLDVVKRGSTSPLRPPQPPVE